MDAEMIKKQAVTFSRSRGVLLAVVAFTVINLLLETFGADFYLLYSASVPQFVLLIADEIGIYGFGLVLALIITAVYLVCWALSKRWRIFILIALILFSLDTLFLLLLVIDAENFSLFLIDLAFCVWILFSLARGSIAWFKLRRVSPDEILALQDEISQAAQTYETDTALNSLLPGQAGGQQQYQQQPQEQQDLPQQHTADQPSPGETQQPSSQDDGRCDEEES